MLHYSVFSNWSRLWQWPAPFKMSHASSSKFAWTCLIFQIVFGILFTLLVRYGDSADAKHKENQLGENHELKENLEKYPGNYSVCYAPVFSALRSPLRSPLRRFVARSAPRSGA